MAVSVSAGPPSSPLDFYGPAGDPINLSLPGGNLSGITWNWDSGTFFLIQNNSGNLTEIDSSLTVLRTISATGFGDAEDLVYLGNNEFAIVNEASFLFIGEVSSTATTLNAGNFQRIMFGEPGGNTGPEGVAYDPGTERFFIVVEKNPMEVFLFPRPTESGNVAIEPIVPFDAQVVLGPLVTDLSSVLFDPRTGRLLILSHESHRIVDVGISGTVFSTVTLADGTQHEGLTLQPDHQLVVVSEPAWLRYYSPSSDPFIFLDGFESETTQRWSSGVGIVP